MTGIRQIVPLLLVLASSYSVAQSTASIVLHEGTPVSLAFVGALDSSTATVGERIQFVLANNIQVDGAVVAKAGSIATGEVIEVKRAALAGRSGQITLRLNGLSAGGINIKIRGGKERTGPSDVQFSRPYHLKWPGGLLRTGDNVAINTGTLLTVFVAEDIPLSGTH